jgi:bifunctional DNase/RNase
MVALAAAPLAALARPGAGIRNQNGSQIHCSLTRPAGLHPTGIFRPSSLGLFARHATRRTLSNSRRSPRSLPRPSAASYYEQPFPFDPADYHRVILQVVQGQEHVSQGWMKFQLEGAPPEDNAMAVNIGGDTFLALAHLLQGRAEARPLTVDLLWRCIERAAETDPRTWTVLRVAITGISESIFLGRVFFGDPATGQVVWDVDCRPSDAVWLSTKLGAPLYIHRAIWETYAAPQEELQGRLQSTWQMATFSEFQREQGAEVAGPVVSEPVAAQGRVDTASLMTTVRRSDPEPLKLLKMELKVALAEEDYGAAARLRDHPFMKMHVAAATAWQAGDMDAASRYEQRLRRDIARSEAGERVGE